MEIAGLKRIRSLKTMQAELLSPMGGYNCPQKLIITQLGNWMSGMCSQCIFHPGCMSRCLGVSLSSLFTDMYVF